MFRVVFSWNEFFSTEIPSIFKDTKCISETKTASSGGQYVSNCIFFACSSSNGGGILSTNPTNLLIEETTFSGCSATDGCGGGLYFVTTGSCVLSKVCSFACLSSTNGLLDSLEYNSTIIDSSVSYTNWPNSKNAICHSYGKICVSSVNSSKNIGNYHVGIDIAPSSSCDYGDCLISYSCFIDIESKSYITVLYGGGGKGKMKSCNVVNNTQASVSNYGTVCSNSPLNVYDSIVTGNNAQISYYGNGQTIYLYNTIFDKETSNVVVKESASVSFTNHLKFIKCDFEFGTNNECTCNRRTFTNSITMLILSCIIFISK